MDAESQNIEQMVGLFRKNQYASLALHATQILFCQGC